MIRSLRRRYLLIQSDGLTKLSVPLSRHWTHAGALHAMTRAGLQKAAEGRYGDRYSFRVAVR
jgi:hypothetical protein